MSMMMKSTNPIAPHTAMMMIVVVSIGLGAGTGVTNSNKSPVAV